MREIKFRAWNKGINKMFSAEEMGEDELTINPDGRGFVNVNSTSTKLSQYCPHMVPMQYTGYVDINKIDIYEGDILKDSFNRILLVEWRRGGFCFKALTDTNFKHACTISQWFEFDMHPPLVIGNRYENPELVHSSNPRPRETFIQYYDIFLIAEYRYLLSGKDKSIGETQHDEL